MGPSNGGWPSLVLRMSKPADLSAHGLRQRRSSQASPSRSIEPLALHGTAVTLRALPGTVVLRSGSHIKHEVPVNGYIHPQERTPSLVVNRSEDVPVSYPKAALDVAWVGEKSCKKGEADARTRTGDPFITREKQVRDGRPRAGTWGHLLAVNWVLSQASRWTRVPASARVDVPVLYPS